MKSMITAVVFIVTNLMFFITGAGIGIVLSVKERERHEEILRDIEIERSRRFEDDGK